MTLVDLEQPLRDSILLRQLAEYAGITETQAKAMLAAQADMEIRDVLRLTETCRKERVRAANRETRRR